MIGIVGVHNFQFRALDFETKLTKQTEKAF